MPVPNLRPAACLVLAVVTAVYVRGAAAQAPTTGCDEPQACRELALEARTAGAYERFHDLAWRALQTGRPNDPDLMYLLARAQALSGRRRDALVMLRRLAEAGFANDAATDDDFRRVRELPEWQSIVAIVDRPRPVVREAAPAAPPAKPPAVVPPPSRTPVATAKPPAATAPAPAAAAPAPAPAAPPPATPAVAPEAAAAVGSAPPAVAPAPNPAAALTSPPPAAPAPKPAAALTPPPPAAAARSALRVEPATVEDAARFSTGAFTPAGIAHDAVSRRFLFADRAGRRLFVVGEGSERSVDLVRADSAGFEDVTALAIDPKRGDLWVASSAADGTSGAVHRLQLISGRALAKIAVPGKGAARLSDLAVASDGTVFALDSAAPRILVLRRGATAVEVLMTLKTPEPVSIAVDNSGQFAYVAHRDGITRLDLQTRRAAPMEAAKGITLAGFEFIRLHRGTIVGGQVQSDASRGVVRLQIKNRTITQATLIETPENSDDTVTLATISDGDLYYLVASRTESGDSAAGLMNVRVRRIKLP